MGSPRARIHKHEWDKGKAGTSECFFWMPGEGGRTAGADRVGSLLQADASCHKKIDELFSGKLYLIGIAAIVVAVIMVSITTVGMGSGKLDLYPADPMQYKHSAP